MHPAVEDPHPHEPPIAVRADRGQGGCVPVVNSHVAQAFTAIGDQCAEPLVQVGAGFCAQVTDPALVGAPDVVAHVRQCRDVDIGLGCADAVRTDSVPMMWATTLWTVQPGSGVGVCHCSSDSPVSNRSRLSQVPKRPDSTSDLSSSVTGRAGLLTGA